jgi:hypothetical protein
LNSARNNSSTKITLGCFVDEGALYSCDFSSEDSMLVVGGASGTVTVLKVNPLGSSGKTYSATAAKAGGEAAWQAAPPPELVMAAKKAADAEFSFADPTSVSIDNLFSSVTKLIATALNLA